MDSIPWIRIQPGPTFCNWIHNTGANYAFFYLMICGVCAGPAAGDWLLPPQSSARQAGHQITRRAIRQIKKGEQPFHINCFVCLVSARRWQR